MSAVVEQKSGPKEAGTALAVNQGRQVAIAIGLRVVNTEAQKSVEDADRHYKPAEGIDE